MSKILLTDDFQLDAEAKAEAVAEIACRIATDQINLSDGSHSANVAMDDMRRANIKLRSSSSILNLSNGNAGADGVAGVGPNTLQIFNELIQDVSPGVDLIEGSPYNSMLPFRTVDAMVGQQDIIDSNYGWAEASNGVDGAMNPVPLLGTNSKTYTGYLYNAYSYIAGNDLIKWRELGSSNLTDRGLMQRLALQQILLTQQVKASVELVRTEAIMKGSFTFKDSVISSGFDSSQVTVASQSLGSYSVANNVITINPAITSNLIKEIGIFLVGIQNMGIKIKEFIIPNTIFNALFNTPAVEAKTVYMSAVSSNDVGGIRDNLFRITTIPSLQSVAITSDDRSIKTVAGKTTTKNTRPVMYGETITTSSFRGIVVTEQSGMSRVGSMGFFPNVYTRGANVVGGNVESMAYNGNIALITQDMAPGNFQNQRIQMMATTCISPMFYLPNTVFLFDFGVTLTA